MQVSKAVRTVIVFEMEVTEAEVICADLLFLLESTKDIAAMVPGGSVASAIECRERLEKLQSELKGALK